MAEQIKALSEYFKNGGKWGEGEDAPTLSPDKLVKAVTDAIVQRRPLYKKVFKVADHFHVSKDGEVTSYATVGDYRREAEGKGLTRQQRGRNGREGKTVLEPAYRDFAILDVPAFEEWLSKTVHDGKVDVIIKRRSPGNGVRANQNRGAGIYSLADFRKRGDLDTDRIAKEQSEVIQTRKQRGEELGNSRKESSKK